MRFKLSGLKRTALTCIITNLKALTSRITYYCNVDGLRIQGLDTSQVCMFDAYLPAEWFDEYKSENNHIITAPTAILAKIMAICTGSQSILLKSNQDSDVLRISFTGDKAVCDKEFKVPLLEEHSELTTIPNMESDVDLSLPAKNFHELVAQLGIFSDTFNVRFDADKVEFKSVGDDGTMTAKLEEYEYSISEDTVLTQSFSLKYVHTMCSFWKLSEEAVLEFRVKKPLSLTYKLNGSESELAYLRFHLAPKIDDDE